MELLGIILVILSIIKLSFVFSLNRFKIKDVIAAPFDIEYLTEIITGYFLLDGLVGLFCGIFLLLI